MIDEGVTSISKSAFYYHPEITGKLVIPDTVTKPIDGRETSGKYKNLHWSFQSEWRYILTILPFDINQPVEKSMLDFQIIANKMKLGLERQPFSHYDMYISDDAFADMEITLSPRISAGSRIIVENLLEKFNPSAALTESHLVGLI